MLQLYSTYPSLDHLSQRLRLTACLLWPPQPFLTTLHLSSFLPAPPPPPHAAVWLVLPWHPVSRKRLHIQHLVFFSQRAAEEGLLSCDAETQPCVWTDDQHSEAHVPCQPSVEGQSHFLWLFMGIFFYFFTEEFYQRLVSFSFGTCFEHNHFWKTHWGILPHVMHIYGYQWLIG